MKLHGLIQYPTINKLVVDILFAKKVFSRQNVIRQFKEPNSFFSDFLAIALYKKNSLCSPFKIHETRLTYIAHYILGQQPLSACYLYC